MLSAVQNIFGSGENSIILFSMNLLVFKTLCFVLRVFESYIPMDYVTTVEIQCMHEELNCI